MVFYPPKSAGELPEIPDNIPISDFILTEHYGRVPLGYSRDPYTCGVTGKSYSTLEVTERVDYLSRALAKEFNWAPNQGTEWDKTVGIFTLNSVSFLNSRGEKHCLTSCVNRLTRCLCAGQHTNWEVSQHLRMPPTLRPS